MGLAIIIPDLDASADNLGKVEIPTDILANAIEIVCDDAISADKVQLNVRYIPASTTIKGVEWSILSGNEYAQITPQGRLTINKDVVDAPVTIKVVYTQDNSIYDIRDIKVTYQDHGPDDSDIYETYPFLLEEGYRVVGRAENVTLPQQLQVASSIPNNGKTVIFCSINVGPNATSSTTTQKYIYLTNVFGVNVRNSRLGITNTAYFTSFVPDKTYNTLWENYNDSSGKNISRLYLDGTKVFDAQTATGTWARINEVHTAEKTDTITPLEDTVIKKIVVFHKDTI